MASVRPAGLYKKIVAFRVNNPTQLGAGGQDSYSTLCKCRGYLKRRGGSRVLSYGEITEFNSYDLWVRYSKTIEDSLQVDTKILIEGKTYTISSWERVDESLFELHFSLNVE